MCQNTAAFFPSSKTKWETRIVPLWAIWLIWSAANSCREMYVCNKVKKQKHSKHFALLLLPILHNFIPVTYICFFIMCSRTLDGCEELITENICIRMQSSRQASRYCRHGQAPVNGIICSLMLSYGRESQGFGPVHPDCRIWWIRHQKKKWYISSVDVLSGSPLLAGDIA